MKPKRRRYRGSKLFLPKPLRNQTYETESRVRGDRPNPVVCPKPHVCASCLVHAGTQLRLQAEAEIQPRSRSPSLGPGRSCAHLSQSCSVYFPSTAPRGAELLVGGREADRGCTHDILCITAAARAVLGHHFQRPWFKWVWSKGNESYAQAEEGLSREPRFHCISCTSREDPGRNWKASEIWGVFPSVLLE